MATVKERLTALKDALVSKLNQLHSLIEGKADKTITISAGTGLAGGGTLESNRTINHASHTGDVTGATALTIGNNKVTFAKMQDIAAQKLVGRYSASTGDPQLISIGDGLALDANSGVLSATNQGGLATALPIVKYIERTPTSYFTLSSLQFTTIDSFVFRDKEMIDHEYRGELAISVSAHKNASYGTIRLELFNKSVDIELPKLDSSLATGSASVMVYVQYKLRFREYGNQTYCRLQFLGTANYTYFGYDGVGGSQVFNSVESSLDRTADRTFNVQMKKTTTATSNARVESHFVELLYRPINE